VIACQLVSQFAHGARQTRYHPAGLCGCLLYEVCVPPNGNTVGQRYLEGSAGRTVLTTPCRNAQKAGIGNAANSRPGWIHKRNPRPPI
jgi:hypothetical protein